MKKYPTKEIRNIGIVAHGGAGKTSLAEAALFVTGAIKRLGRVEDGNTTTDYDPDEVKRKISISTALAPCEWGNQKINFIDAPGYADFIGEVIEALQVVDAALVVVNAVAGVEVQTERVWHYADEYKLPRLAFINKMDKENADFHRTLNMIKEVFNAGVVPIQIPIGKEESFRGVIDLVKMKALVYKDGKFGEEDIPAELETEASAYREKLIEGIAELDDELLEKYLEGAGLTQKDIEDGLKSSALAGKIVPVLCGSAFKNIGIQPLLDAIVNLLPSPAELGEIKGVHPKTKEETTRKPTEKEPLSAFVFKTLTDPYVGKLSYVRVYSGTLKADSSIYNPSQGKKEKIAHIYYMRGKNQEETKEVPAGDIAVVPKLTETNTGDTLCDEGKPILFEPIKFPEPLISVAIEPKTKGDEEKLSTSIVKLTEEDPTLSMRRDDEIKQTIVSGIGDMHLDILVDRLHRKFGVEAVLSAPKLPYKETIRSSAKAQGKYKKQTGGRGQYGDAWIEVEPLERGAGYEFVDKIFGGAIPKGFIPAVEKGVKEAMESGVLAGYPVVDVKVTLYDGSYHPVDSSEIAFKIAGSLAFKKAATAGNPVLLEPIMKMEVVVPEEYMGDVMGDLSSKRGKILGMEARGRHQVINALAPLAEVSRYTTELRSITHGRGSYSIEFSYFEEVPGDIAQKIIEAAKKE
ncbi:MAG: elongation factor G [Actinomycetota bacterium]|nr:elongation factor G [Actinomycetota bacterium]